jgi:transposase
MPGQTSTPARDPTAPPRRRAPIRQGHGTSAHARPPLSRVLSRETGEPRFGVCDHADRRTGADLIAEHVPCQSAVLYTDAWQSNHGSHPAHATVRPGVHEWARDDEGDGRWGVHFHACEGAGAALRTYWRVFRGDHKPFLYHDVAPYEAMLNAKHVTPHLIRRLCVGDPAAHTSYT